MHIVNGVLTKSAFCAVRVLTVFFGAGLIATAFAGSPGDSKKEVQAVQPALCDPPWYISLSLGLDIDTGVNSSSMAPRFPRSERGPQSLHRRSKGTQLQRRLRQQYLPNPG